MSEPTYQFNQGPAQMQAGTQGLAGTLGQDYMDSQGINKFGAEAPGGGFDWGGAMDNFSMGAQGVMGLANAYTAYKQLGLMEDQLAMQKGMANRNVANQAKTTNRMLDDRSTMAAQMHNTEYGTQAFKDKKSELQTTVDGSPVA